MCEKYSWYIVSTTSACSVYRMSFHKINNAYLKAETLILFMMNTPYSHINPQHHSSLWSIDIFKVLVAWYPRVAELHVQVSNFNFNFPKGPQKYISERRWEVSTESPRRVWKKKYNSPCKAPNLNQHATSNFNDTVLTDVYWIVIRWKDFLTPLDSGPITRTKI